MYKSLDKVLKDLPSKRQKSIEAKAGRIIKEYKSLQALRKKLGITQAEVANKQGISQVTISKLEKRGDMHLSTLKKYAEALGGKLEIYIRMEEDELSRITIPK